MAGTEPTETSQKETGELKGSRREGSFTRALTQVIYSLCAYIHPSIKQRSITVISAAQKGSGSVPAAQHPGASKARLGSLSLVLLPAAMKGASAAGRERGDNCAQTDFAERSGGRPRER